MSDLWQAVLVTLLVGGAALSLAVRVWRKLRGGPIEGCGGCHGCGADAGKKGAPPAALVTLEPRQ
jgi:mono/diheme cytochrome c family protein